MAKGQQRSNREVRKPKQDKAKAAAQARKARLPQKAMAAALSVVATVVESAVAVARQDICRAGIRSD